MKNVNLQKIIKYFTIILFYLFVLFVYMFDGRKGVNVYPKIVLIILISVATFYMAKDLKIRLCYPIIVTFILSAYCWLSQFWSIDSDMAITVSKTLFLLSLFMLFVLNLIIKLDIQVDTFIKILIFAGITFCIYILFYYGVDSYFKLFISGERIGKEIDNVNSIGLRMTYTALLAFFWGINKDKRYCFLSLLPIIIGVGTKSKKALIFIFLGIFLLLLQKNNSGKINIEKIFKILIIIITCVVLIISLRKITFLSNLFDRIILMLNYFIGNGKTDRSTLDRMLFIKIGMQQFYETPIFGIGAGNSGFITYEAVGTFTYLHNNFVELLSTTGIVGFSLYYSIYAYIIYFLIKYLKKDIYVKFTLGLFILMLSMDVGLVSYNIKNTYIIFIFGLLVLYKAKIETEKEKKHE